MTFSLTTKGDIAVREIRAKIEYLRPEYKNNTLERVIFEMGHIPMPVVMFAAGQSTPADLTEMVKQGYAKYD